MKAEAKKTVFVETSCVAKLELIVVNIKSLIFSLALFSSLSNT